MINPHKPNLKYYGFDWDDNLVYMPTKIILRDQAGNPYPVSTQEFSHIRMRLDELSLTIDENTMANFGLNAAEQFLADIESAPTAGSWNDFVECVNSGSIFSIITARGHDKETIKQGVKNIIDLEKDGINRSHLLDSLRQYRALFPELREDASDEELINEYLELCRFYPLTNENMKAELSNPGENVNIEDLKVRALEEFISHVENLGALIRDKIEISGNIKIGFSDDDIQNISTIENWVTHHQVNIETSLYYTGGSQIKS